MQPRNQSPIFQLLIIVGLAISLIMVYTIYNPIVIVETKEDYCRGIGLIVENTIKAKRKGIPLYLIVEKANKGFVTVPPQILALMSTVYNMENDDPYRVKKIFVDNCLKFK